MMKSSFSHKVRIFFVDGEKNLKKFLQATNEASRKFYWGQSAMSSEMEALFEAHRFSRLSFEDNLGKDDIGKVVDVIGQLSCRFHSRMWWATDLSSRNRFKVKLPEILLAYRYLRTFIENDEGEVLVIVGASRSLKRTLESDISGTSSAWNERKTPFWKMSKKLAVLFVHSIQILYRMAYSRLKLSKKWQSQYEKFKKNPLYCIKSFTYDRSFSKEDSYVDAFFGPLIKFLQTRDKKVFILTNILGDFRSSVKLIRDLKCVDVYPLDFFLSFSEVLREVKNIVCFNLDIKDSISFCGYDVAPLIREYLHDEGGKIQLYQALHYAATSRLLKRLEVGIFLLTYENNPWERMCVQAVRDSSPETYVIGYQHAAVPLAALNMFVGSLEGDIVPKLDLILTTGEAPARMLQNYSRCKGLNIQPACALRFEYLFNWPRMDMKIEKDRANTKVLLLALEGIADARIINIVLKWMRNNEDWKIIIRPHPTASFESFKDGLDKAIFNCSHFEVSQGKTLQDDLLRSDVILYWGSTVALESLWLGKPVIHLDMGTIFNYDSLFECSYLKWRMKSEDNLNNILNDICALKEDELKHQQSQAYDYLKNYFFPIDEGRLESFLSIGERQL